MQVSWQLPPNVTPPTSDEAGAPLPTESEKRCEQWRGKRFCGAPLALGTLARPRAAGTRWRVDTRDGHEEWVGFAGLARTTVERLLRAGAHTSEDVAASATTLLLYDMCWAASAPS